MIVDHAYHAHRQKVRQCFNRAHATYDAYSIPQQIIGNQLIEYLQQYVSHAKTMIDLGCGTGVITEVLANVYPYEHFYAIDIADQLIEHAKRRLSHTAIQCVIDDFSTFAFAKQNQFDLAFANMSLQWSRALPHTLLHIKTNMAPSGFLAFTLPLMGTFKELTHVAINDLYACDEIIFLLKALGFELINYFSAAKVFRFPSWLNAIQSIKATGANYVVSRGEQSERNRKTVTRKAWLSLQHEERDDDAAAASTACLTYQTGFFIAKNKTHVI